MSLLPNTAFGQVRTTVDEVLLDQTFDFNINARKWNTFVSGSGSVSVENNTARISTGAGVNSTALLQSIFRVKFRLVQSVTVRFSARFTLGIPNTNQYIGIGDSTDGFFIGYNGEQFGILHRNSLLSTTWVPNTEWNGDKATGQYVLPDIDFTKGNIFQITYTLGYGSVIFYVLQPRTGKFIKVHTLDFGNKFTITSTAKNTLPFRYEVSGQNVDIYSPHCTILSDTAVNVVGVINSASNLDIEIPTGGPFAVLTIRNRTTFEGKENTNLIFPETVYVSMLSGSANVPTVVNVIENAVLANNVFTNLNTANSIVQVQNTNPATTYTGGNLITSIAFGAGGNVTIDLKALKYFISPGNSLTLGISVSTQTSVIVVTIVWREDL